MLRVGVTIHKEDEWYIAMDTVSGVTSQGKSCDEALKNFREAFKLWLENAEEWAKERALKSEPVVTMILEMEI